MDPVEDELRRLAINDEQQIAMLMTMLPVASRDGRPDSRAHVPGRLDPRAHALACLSALIAVDAAQVSLEHGVSEAIAQGATTRDIVALLAAIGPAVGYPRVVAAAPRVAAALGFDLDEALEVIGADAYDRPHDPSPQEKHP